MSNGAMNTLLGLLPDPPPAVPKAGPQLSPIAALSLRSGTVTIGPILPEDAGVIFLWLNDVEAANLDMPYRPIDWMGFNAWMAEFAKGTSQILFAIRRVDDPNIIGFAALTKIHPIHRSAELSVRIGNQADRGQGYGTEAIGLMVKYAWNHLNLNRVYLSVFGFNLRAQRAYEAAGFQNEGTQRLAAFIDGNWVDVVLMSILRRPDGG
jgi:RimJ/RimL family protein N-acetyltransferase